MKDRVIAIALGLVACGLVLWFLSYPLAGSVFLNVDLSSFLANLGSFILVIGVLQFSFDYLLRDGLYQVIVRQTLSAVRIRESGVVDFAVDTKKIDYTDLIESSRDIYLCSLYSVRVLTDNLSAFEKRVKRGHNTCIIVCDPAGSIPQAVREVTSDTFDATMAYRRLEEVAAELRKCGSGKVEIKLHGTLLRYCFVSNSEGAWIKLYMNCKGRKAVPGFRVRAETVLFNTYMPDIEKLIAEAKSV